MPKLRALAVEELERAEDQLPQDIQADLTVLGSLLHYQVEGGRETRRFVSIQTLGLQSC